MNERFRGIFSALLTAFDAAGDFSESAQRAMLRYELTTGVRGFYVGGSTGEVFLLSEKERKALYRVSAEEVAGKRTMIAHIGAISTREAVKYAKYCASLGYDAVSSVTPFYYKFSTEEIAGYYRAIADAADVPVLLYHIPLRMRRAHPEKVLYNGFDETCICGLAMGADGAIGSTYNVIGDRFVRIWELCGENRFAEAATLQHEANDLIAFLLKAGDVKAAVKYVMKEKRGIDAGTCRAPGGDVPESWKAEYSARFAYRF